jgi:hypothetical protein
MNSGESGSLNRSSYDRCAYEKQIVQSTTPMLYRMSMDAYENSKKCVYNNDSFYHPYDDKIVDTESELKGLGRPLSKCGQNQYNPNCEKSSMCTSTYDPSVPVVLAQEVCPIVKNNLQKILGVGYELDIQNNKL